MDRRSLLAAAPIAAVALVAPVTALSATTGVSAYYAELDAIDRETARLNAVPASAAEWDHWEEWSTRIWREIEALPPTQENAKLKARAVWSIISGNMEDLNMGQSTCCRMVRQIISGLAA